ncbi:sialidase family protein [Nakamurella aerolata]|uniref:sialidase family protein n=1 Tax=Nakamurella aerolata TaxID=1656892 RepID=UPI001BB164D1|nr:sialidase family protein [Nakamurella aerolata]
MSPAPFSRRRLLNTVLPAAAAAPLVGVLGAAPAQAAVTFWGKIVQEPGDYEARFPDLLKLNDGRIMAVWHRAASHSGTVGTIQVSYGSADGKTWSTPHVALANPGTMAGIDTRDPKLGKMNDGSVILTFFVPGGKVYYSVWKPGWGYFTDPTELVAAGIGGKYSHGGALALANNGSQVNHVLVPVYTTGTSGGAWYIRTRWDASTNKLVVLEGARRIISNNNPVGRTYTEPSFVQFGSTVVCAVRAEQNGAGSPVIIARWNPYTAAPSYTFQSFTGVLANSHHLLKTSDGKVLFTYGDKSQSVRPTVGMLISNPTGTWVKGKVLGIYNSGANDQANPSSVEIAAGSFLTTGYNAKTKAASSSGGTLWLLHSSTADY